MQNILKYSIIIPIFMLLICDACFPYNNTYKSNYYNTTQNGNSQITTNFLGSPITPIINSVRLRQDDTYYYFDFDLDFKNESIKQSNYSSFSPGDGNMFMTSIRNTWPSFDHTYRYTYSSANISTDTEESKGKIYYNGRTFTYHYVHQQHYVSGQLTRNDYPTDEETAVINIPISGLSPSYWCKTPRYLNGQYVKYTAPEVAGITIGTGTISCRATKMSSTYWHYNYKGTARVVKNDFDTCRYLSFLSANAVRGDCDYDSNNNSTWGTETMYDIRGNSIDLSEYKDCDHNWYLVNIGDKNVHERRCEHCEWPTPENHELVYEYCGIENNRCACGYNSTVYYTFIFDDDENGTIEIPVSSYEEIPDISVSHKTGYKFKWYEKYEKHVDENGDAVNVYIATTSTIDRSGSNYSTIYKAIFEPITYTFNFSNENNMGLELDGEVNDQTFTYDTPSVVNEGIYYKGRNFVGWTFTKGSSIADIKAGESVLNHTACDLENFTLYPVYEVTRFTLRYNTDDGKFANEKKIYSVRYAYDDEKVLERPHDYYPEGQFRDYFYNGKPIKYLSEMKEYAVLQDMIFDLYAYIYVPPIGRTERSTDGLSPSAGGGLSGKKEKMMKNDIDDGMDDDIGIYDTFIYDSIYDDDKNDEIFKEIEESDTYGIVDLSAFNESMIDGHTIKYFCSDHRPKFLTTFMYRNSSAIMIITVILVVGLCLFVQNKEEESKNGQFQ